MTNMKEHKLDVCVRVGTHGGVGDVLVWNYSCLEELGVQRAPFPDQVLSHDVCEPTNSFNVTHKDEFFFSLLKTLKQPQTIITCFVLCA